eukprot:452920-Rhodomonas_salina.1
MGGEGRSEIATKRGRAQRLQASNGHGTLAPGEDQGRKEGEGQAHGGPVTEEGGVGGTQGQEDDGGNKAFF